MEAWLSQHPTREIDEPATKDFVDSRLAESETRLKDYFHNELHREVNGLRSEITIAVDTFRSELVRVSDTFRSELVRVSDTFRSRR